MGILTPISDIFVLIYGLTEPIVSHLTQDHPNWIYSHFAVLLWVTKLLSAVVGLTVSNGTLTAAFNDTLHTLSTNSNDFFGNFTGKSGMSYIAKHAYLELVNNKTLANDLAVKFARAINSTVIFIMKAFEFL
jgi:hypothetical protein